MPIKRPSIKQPIPAHGRLVHKGIIFDTYQWEQEMYDGSVKTFEKLKRADTVVVLAITENKKVLVNFEEQPGKGRFINLPGGRIENGESVEKACARELLEETGYQAEKLQLWFTEQPASKMDYIVYFVIAKNCRKIASQSLDSGEKIELAELDFNQFYAAALDPKFADKEIKLELLLAEKQGRLVDLEKMFLES